MQEYHFAISRIHGAISSTTFQSRELPIEMYSQYRAHIYVVIRLVKVTQEASFEVVSKNSRIAVKWANNLPN